MDIKVIKLKIRRGTNDQRKQVVFDEGELGYTIDTQRLYVGTGYVSGGVPVSSRIHPPLIFINSLTGLNAEIGDIVNANNIMYQLVGSNPKVLGNWQIISPALNTDTLTYRVQDNAISIKNNSITTTYLNYNTLSSSTVYFDPDDSNRLAVIPQSLDHQYIKPAAFSGGITGGGVDQITLATNGVSAANVHPSTFSDGVISGNDVNGFTISYQGVKPQHINSNIVGTGLQGGAGLPLSLNIDDSLFYFTTSGEITSNLQTIFDTVTGYDEYNPSFNGDPLSNSNIMTEAVSVTQIQALSSRNGMSVYIMLTSAGFITFTGNKPASNNSNHIPARYAIPIFSW